MVKKKKGVKDKYYELAKEQGYRARSCFKLIQLNRKYDFLSTAKVTIDLCAAPGGWLQVLAENMRNTNGRAIIGVDLLPIKPVNGCITHVSDITTAHCRQLIRKDLNGRKADVVLCDGAPNVGATYTKDAFVQNELAVHAFKFAADHLKPKGTFITKVFRSQDYNALLWAFQQLFKKVEATKPASSRNVSAEIFVVCRDYISPDKIDPKLFDIEHVFKQVDSKKSTNSSFVSELFHKKSNQKKNRNGYDESLGQSLFKKVNVFDFLKTKEPIKILATSNEIFFNKNNENDKVILNLSITTDDIVHMLKDIKVLNKSDLKNLLKWRKKVKSELKRISELSSTIEQNQSSKEGETGEEAEEKAEVAEEEGESDIEEEIRKVMEAEERKKRKEKKKENKKKQKLRIRKELGIEEKLPIDFNDEKLVFSLKTMKQDTTEEELKKSNFREFENEEKNDSNQSESEGEEDKDKNYLKEIENEAMEEYKIRKEKEKELDFKPMSIKQRRQMNKAQNKAKQKRKTLQRLVEQDMEKIVEETREEMLNEGAYEKMINDSDSDSEQVEQQEEDSKGSDSESEVEEEGEVTADVEEENNVEVEKEEESEESEEEKSADEEELEAVVDLNRKKLLTEQWFSNPIFEGVKVNIPEKKVEEDEVEVTLPFEKTDKHKRQIKRAKSEQKKKNREAKRKKKQDKEKQSITLAQVVDKNGDKPIKNQGLAEEEEELKKKSKKVRKLIAKGMGNIDIEEKEKPIEFVKQEKKDPLDEEYNFSDYDSDTNATTIALATMLTKKSTRRKLLDSSYNRYVFNDNDNLPEWFVEDERKHFKPILPVTKEMVERIKKRQLEISKKPIKKVHEARMRKRKRLAQRLETAKKKAAAIVENEDLGSVSKSKMIQKLYKKAAKKEGKDKVYIVSRTQGKGSKVKNTRNLGAKGLKGKRIKLVDKRMRADNRSLKSKSKRRKKR